MNRRRLLASLAGFSAASCTAALHPASPALRRLEPSDFGLVLDGIAGAEGLASAPNGRLAFSTAKAAVGILEPDGTVRYVGPSIETGGIAFDRQGRVVAASVGALRNRPGPLRRIDLVSNTVEVLASELEGRRLVASNCPAVAHDGTIYCSHSGWSVGNIGTTSAEGFIYAVDTRGSVRIVARRLRGANGLCIGRGDRHLYAALTAEGRVMRWEREANGDLVNPAYYGPVLGSVFPNQTATEIRALDKAARGRTGYCDGLAMDEAGNLFVTLPFANRIVAITPQGNALTLVHDPEGTTIDFPTNLAWGGKDRRKLFVVSRGSGKIVSAVMPYPGVPGANWPAGQ
ncbi:MAG: SMP-30/gluconolactonase/LRE family protein [Novosphingobium sp.]|nr:SMP-30/gluconolactonase/LRE family protein [Novosphingobium sp.]